LIILDLNTKWYIPHPAAAPSDQQKADYSIKIVQLNRDYLIAARKTAYHSYINALKVYTSEKAAGANVTELKKEQNKIIAMQHPTVWHEMQRQRPYYPQIDTLFKQAEELMG
jgi:hypothetical protein